MPTRLNLPRYLWVGKLKLPSGERKNTWSFRIRIPGRPQVLRDTGLTERSEALKVAKAAHAAAMKAHAGDRFHVFTEAADATAIRRKSGTVGELRALFRGGAQTVGRATSKRSETDLLLILRTVLGIDNEAADALPLTAINRTLRWKFYAVRQGLPEPDFSTRRVENRSINSTLNSALGCFSKNAVALKYHGKLTLPASVEEFRALPTLPEPAIEWQPFADAAYKAMHEASEGLRDTDPDLWLVNQLLRRLGLRNKELIHARGTWLERDAAGLLLVVKDRPEEGFSQKGVRSRRLPVADDLAAELAGMVGSERHILLPDASPTRRKNLVQKDHNKWLTQFFPKTGTAQGNHQLRKHIGSVIYANFNLEAAADYLGHKDIGTTRRHYQARLDRLPTVTAEDIAIAGRIEAVS